MGDSRGWGSTGGDNQGLRIMESDEKEIGARNQIREGLRKRGWEGENGMEEAAEAQ